MPGLRLALRTQPHQRPACRPRPHRPPPPSWHRPYRRNAGRCWRLCSRARIIWRRPTLLSPPSSVWPCSRRARPCRRRQTIRGFPRNVRRVWRINRPRRTTWAARLARIGGEADVSNRWGISFPPGGCDRPPPSRWNWPSGTGVLATALCGERAREHLVGLRAGRRVPGLGPRLYF